VDENISVVQLLLGHERRTVLSWTTMSVSMRLYNLTSVIKPLYYLCKIFGLASFSLYKEYGTKKDTFLQSGAWWSCAWAVMYAVNFCLGIDNTLHDTKIRVKITIVYILYYVFLYLTSIISICDCSVFKRRKITVILDKIEELSNMFKMRVDRNVTYK